MKIYQFHELTLYMKIYSFHKLTLYMKIYSFHKLTLYMQIYQFHELTLYMKIYQFHELTWYMKIYSFHELTLYMKIYQFHELTLYMKIYSFTNSWRNIIAGYTEICSHVFSSNPRQEHYGPCSSRANRENEMEPLPQTQIFILLSSRPDNVNLLYFKLKLYNLTESIVLLNRGAKM